MLHRSLFLCFFVFSLVSSAQDAVLQWTEDYDFERNTEYLSVVGAKDGIVYTISSSNANPQNSLDVFINTYRADDFSPINSLQVTSSKKDVNFEALTITENKVQLFTSYFDRNLGFKVLTVQEYGVENNSLGEEIRVDEVHMESKGDDQPFTIRLSPNRRYILLHHDLPSTTGNKSLNFKVINEEFTTLWEKSIELNYKERMVGLSELIIDDHSTIYYLSKLNPYGLKRTSGFGSLLNLKNSLFIYHPYKDKLKEFEFALTRNWVRDVSMKLDERQNLMATAFYTYPNDYRMRGFVQFKIHGESGEVLMRKMTALNKGDFKLIEASVSKLKDYSRSIVSTAGIYPGMSSHMNNTSTEFTIRDIHYTGSSMILAVEALRRDERCSESFNEQQMIVNCEKHYLFGDVLLFFMDYEGNIRNIKTLDKMQHSVDRINPYLSFHAFSHDDGLVICYNDHYENIMEDNQDELGNKAVLYKMSKAQMNLLFYDGIGNRSPIQVKRGNEDDVLYYPDKSIWLDSGDLLLFSLSEKNYKFGKLILPSSQ